jgi:hypothetical protein
VSILCLNWIYREDLIGKLIIKFFKIKSKSGNFFITILLSLGNY